MSQALVSLGPWIGTTFRSVETNLAPGVAGGFSAFCAIRGAGTVQGGQLRYFGNTDGATRGWSFRRLPDLAEDPLEGTPALARLAFVLATDAGVEFTAVAQIPRPQFIGRVLFMGASFRGNGTDFSFYLNGTRMAVPTVFAGAIGLGDSQLRYGVSSADSGDRVIGAAYSTETFENNQDELDYIQELVFSRFVRVEGGAVMREALADVYTTPPVAPIPEYIYDSWDLRGPFLATPTTLPNKGTALSSGDLIYAGGGTVLGVEVDTNPNITGPTLIPIFAP